MCEVEISCKYETTDLTIKRITNLLKSSENIHTVMEALETLHATTKQ